MANVNWLAVLVATIAYFALGALWYNVLFSKIWARELGMKMDNPPKGAKMAGMLLKSFLANLLTAIAIALLINYAHGGDWMRSAKIGAVAGFGIAGGTLWMNYNWQSRSFLVWTIDAAYSTLGCAIAGAIIGPWR